MSCKMKAIVNTKLILEDGIIWDGTLLYKEDKIVTFGTACEIKIPEQSQIIDAKGKYTAPGFVDIHNHGGNGAWFYSEPEKASQFFLQHGQTTVLPTVYFNLDYNETIAAIKRIRSASTNGAGRIIKGLYMEGPYMNPKYGSDNKNLKWKGKIDPEESQSIVDCAADFVKVWCIAPEREGIEDFVKYAKHVNPGVVFSIGHSVADPSLIYKLKKYGLKNQTHHTNSGIVEGLARGTRGVGPDEACLYDDDIYAEIICDSQAIHVRPHMLRMVVKLKGTERVILITDSCPFEGSARKGIAQAPDLGYDSEGHLAGSKLTMDAACRNLMKHTPYGLCHAIKFASINPARMVGLDNELGSIEAGKRANLIIIDDMVNIQKVIFEGQEVEIGP
jgi:N-acetylglucosamine-6-phosphate deacetylase